MARVRAMRRRPRATQPDQAPMPVRRFGDLTIDPAAREVRRGNQAIELTRLEFDLLEALSERPRVVLSRRQLLQHAWGADWMGDDHLVEVHIANLRRKLGDDPSNPRYVRTVRGVGYRMGPGA
jgi:DNA-binding response OmpR family regulator